MGLGVRRLLMPQASDAMGAPQAPLPGRVGLHRGSVLKGRHNMPTAGA